MVVILFLLIMASVYAQQNSVSVSMVLIKGGTFMMGSPPANTPRARAEKNDDEEPQHQVTVSSFYMGKYEVTQGQYFEVMGEKPGMHDKKSG